ncbi:MAG: hypothetical protein ACK5TE_10670 [Pseudomonadota bacterium]|jgi:hypothetical protein
MARISYLHPDQVDDPEMNQWLQDAIDTGSPGPENQAIRAHNKVVMRSFTQLIRTMRNEGVLPQELRELMRARIATSWGRMFSTDCHY